MEPDDNEDETEHEELAEVAASAETSERRAALHALVLDPALGIPEVIERCVALAAAEFSSAPVVADDITGSPLGGSPSDHAAGLRRRLVAASVCPWVVRPSHAREKLGRWQRLRLIECLGALRSCWQRGPDGMRRCCLSDKRHRGCRDRRALKPDACQVGELLYLSQEIGGLDFYGQFRPTLVDGAEVAPLEWPSGNSAAARRMVSALWARFREPAHALSIGIRDRVSSMKGEELPRDPSPHCYVLQTEANAYAAAAITHAADTTDTPSTGNNAAGHRAPSPQVVVAGTRVPWEFLPFHATDKTSQNDRYGVRPVTQTVDIPLSLRDRREELGDHALYVVGLLTRAHEERPRNARERAEFADGWHALTTGLLQRDLGQHRVDGFRVERASTLLGTRNSPGMLERLGLIERRSDYSAGGVAGYSQRWRLAAPYRGEKTCEVDLVLRERVSTLPARAKKSGPPVHPWLGSSRPTDD